ncbi:uncharacterized protein STEHIDRAFT_135143 [Stereum hirsutum FP-91666 SS1]|uniref:uncharacterized protein n=1 Tax=Stereum hirsutum (strain FP-91666) TaxID=721885 RepID=UPI000444A91F|nr:uncharacterized protein STEHIDRAFT_135143 [Stereum hirsutum FP-91666 SS1]EIM80807.1 hypothetical protein STEHIDRAFT_135143 [Stereum hirsutum FP-91666 SS1]
MTVMNTIECAGFESGADVGEGSCHRPGTFTCSKYCSKEHQTAHWKAHKRLCKDGMLSPSWKPAYIVENRLPSFMTMGASESPMGTPFGGSKHVWGNIPAIDCLNLSRNEGSSAVDKDINLAFWYSNSAASGDIRNLVQTVNGLPADYRGACNILLNDRDIHIFTRNVLFLAILLDEYESIEEAAEMAVDLSYSMRLSSTTASRVQMKMRVLGMILIGSVMGTPKSTSISIRGKSRLVIRHDMDEFTYLAKRGVLDVPIDVDDAERAMHESLLHPSRQDYRDLYYSGLKPAHRLAASTYRTNGMTRPIGTNLNEFDQPNRTLFSAEGEWLAPDSADPLHGWNMKAILESGKRHGTTEGDLYGALFFHAKEQFTLFAQRLEASNITITVSCVDAIELALILRTNPSAHGFSSFQKPVMFDRIETSNIADWNYAGIRTVLGSWGPLLNRQNRHAALLTHFMNWVAMQPGGSIAGGSPSTSCRLAPMVLMTKMTKELDLFHDTGPAFEKYLRANEADEVAARHGLVRRKDHTIIHKVGGLQLLTWTDRFVEFGVTDVVP